MKHVNWGILATGNIARRFAETLAESETGTAVAVASRDAARADAFAQEFGIPVAYGSYDDLLGGSEGGRRLCEHTSPAARGVGRQGSASGQAHPLREAGRTDVRRGRGRDRGSARERRVLHGSVHVPLPPADCAAGGHRAIRRDRRGAADPCHVQLPDGSRSEAVGSSRTRSAGAASSMSARTACRWLACSPVPPAACRSPNRCRSRASRDSTQPRGRICTATAVLEFEGGRARRAHHRGAPRSAQHRSPSTVRSAA